MVCFDCNIIKINDILREKISRFTLTLNTDGVAVYSNKSIDTRSILLVINELPKILDSNLKTSFSGLMGRAKQTQQ